MKVKGGVEVWMVVDGSKTASTMTILTICVVGAIQDCVFVGCGELCVEFLMKNFFERYTHDGIVVFITAVLSRKVLRDEFGVTVSVFMECDCCHVSPYLVALFARKVLVILDPGHPFIVSCDRDASGNSAIAGSVISELDCLPEREVEKLEHEPERARSVSCVCDLYDNCQEEKRQHCVTIVCTTEKFHSIRDAPKASRASGTACQGGKRWRYVCCH